MTEDGDVPGRKRNEPTTVSILSPSNMQAIATKILKQQQQFRESKKGPNIMNMNLVHTPDLESNGQWNNLNIQL